MVKIPEIEYPYQPVGPATNKWHRLKFAKMMQGHPRALEDLGIQTNIEPRRSFTQAPLIPVAVGLLSRVSGFEAFRKTKTEVTGLGGSRLESTIYGVKDWLVKPLIPAAVRLDPRRNDKQYLPQLGLLADGFGMVVPLALGGRELENVAAILAARIAYNIAVEVVPDALRAVRKRINPVSTSTLAV